MAPLKRSPFLVEHSAALGKVPLLVVHDLLESPLSRSAHYVLPAAAWSEKDGTFVNHAGLAQAIRRAAHPPGEARAEGQVFSMLLGRRGLYRAADVRPELARDVPVFSGFDAKPQANGTRLELPMVS
jgi:NADH-quinone oxidoreductase subunit G